MKCGALWRIERLSWCGIAQIPVPHVSNQRIVVTSKCDDLLTHLLVVYFIVAVRGGNEIAGSAAIRNSGSLFEVFIAYGSVVECLCPCADHNTSSSQCN